MRDVHGEYSIIYPTELSYLYKTLICVNCFQVFVQSTRTEHNTRIRELLSAAHAYSHHWCAGITIRPILSPNPLREPLYFTHCPTKTDI
jgi:hypothetical protein